MAPKALAAAIALASLASCSTIPKDPEGTLDRVRGGQLLAGAVESEPWVSWKGDHPSGIEVELIEEFAQELRASVVWVQGSEQHLMEALEVRSLDVVVGGLVSTNPWASRVGFTHPYVTTRLVVATPVSERAPDDIAGLRVRVERGSAAGGLVRNTDAVPVEVEQIDDGSAPSAVDDWLLDDLRLRHTGVTLQESDHTIAVPWGENRFMTRLEDFLLAREDRIRRRVQEAGP